MILPNFLLIGAEKAGTTALSQFLRQHPEVCFSRPKETWFFNRRYDKGVEWFASHFEHWDGEPAIGEGTARLLQSEEAPARIHEHIPDVQLLCILRNPIERAFSQYHFYVYTGKEDPERSFGEVIRDETSDFGRDLIQQGKYIRHLRRYERVFSRKQIHVELHRDLRENSKQVVRSLYDTLGIDTSYEPDTETEHNVTKYPASRTVYEMIRRGWRAVAEPVEPHIPWVANTLRSLVRRVLFDSEKPTMNADDRAYLRRVFEEPNRELQDWLDRDLSHWT
jgi:hypothetical protein